MVIDENKIKEAQEAFDELTPFDKAEFMKANIEWAACNDLEDELVARGYYIRYTSKI